MLNVILWLVGVLVGAGIAWGTATARADRLRRDVNGIGTKANRLERLENERFNAICLAVMSSIPEEKREAVAGLLKIGATL